MEIQELLESIHNCPYLADEKLHCGRDNFAHPHTTAAKDSQKIMLVTRDPSNQANRLKSVLDIENSFFSGKILPILFNEYDINEFETFRKRFEKLVYWTHYQKCFPGVTTNGHKQPTKTCADRYLTKELELINPDLLILVGSHSIEFFTGNKQLQAIERNGHNSIEVKGQSVKVISLTHPSNANNKAKNDPQYKFTETKSLIKDSVRDLETI
ncbi:MULTISPECIES: uracil-DNA glycosylase family protein [unclassified Oceanispirochaeta]|uniref:uracil-DNA glycosylase family protein n=1 Tax=unclassified Oceanispirochaeta TaxID=2635722 RepID=UPI000E0975D6|nr:MULTISPECIES: uracil-DNA glycosylase family protein [unclassified Oceanispirochaeta]MBF9018488.1 hypothetical protein [Oceanispirochaeta sp. M2]NPD74895.1 hypothetical protein [Oceanispirochaeta sp. M1]RDG29282.1 hypothetical protein DV872_22620 [Oceanispirochaeta sp. M1]